MLLSFVRRALVLDMSKFYMFNWKALLTFRRISIRNDYLFDFSAVAQTIGLLATLSDQSER